MASIAHVDPGKRQLFVEDIAWRFLLILILAFGGIVLSMRSTEAHPLYSCSGSSHCHAIVDWGNPVDGASALIKIQPISCGTCGGFVSNEIWYVGTGSGCPSDHCWVEAGYSTWGIPNAHTAASCTGGIANCFFWADNRPNGGGYHEFTTANITQYNVWGNFSISRSSGTSSTWNVYVNGIQKQSTSNYFGYAGTQAYIEVGEELYGTNGAASPRVDFENNSWLGINSSTWQYQSNDGSKIVQSPPPPYGNWATPPSKSSTGGDWWACTSSGC